MGSRVQIGRAGISFNSPQAPSSPWLKRILRTWRCFASFNEYHRHLTMKSNQLSRKEEVEKCCFPRLRIENMLECSPQWAHSYGPFGGFRGILGSSDIVSQNLAHCLLYRSCRMQTLQQIFWLRDFFLFPCGIDDWLYIFYWSVWALFIFLSLTILTPPPLATVSSNDCNCQEPFRRRSLAFFDTLWVWALEGCLDLTRQHFCFVTKQYLL